MRLWYRNLAFIVFLSVANAGIGSSFDNTQRIDPKPELYLLALAPYPDPHAPERFKPRWTSGLMVIPAARLAVELINNQTSILSNYTLALIEEDSGCNELNMKGLLSYVQGILDSGKRVLGVVGPDCSSVAVQIGPLVRPERAAMVHVTTATSPALTNRSEYPYTYLIISSSRQFATVFLEIMRINDWRRFGVLYDGLSIYHLDTFTALTTELQYCNMTSALEYHSAMYNFHFPLQQVKDSHLRIFLVLTGPRLARQLLCLALRHDPDRFLFPNYQWIFIETSLEELSKNISFITEQRSYFCSKHDLLKILEGSVLLFYNHVTNQPGELEVPGLTYSQYQELYRIKVQEHARELNVSIPPDLTLYNVYSNAYHDGVWAVALALNASIQELSKRGESLSDYVPGRKSIAEVICQQISEGVEFDGVSGKVMFDNSTGQTVRSTDLFQVQAQQLYSVGTFASNDFVSNGSYIADSFATKHAHIHTATLVVFLVLSLVLLVAVVLVHMINVCFRNYKSVKASSPRLNHLMFIGSYLLVIALLELLTLGYSPPSNPTIGRLLCNSVLCFSHLGMSLIFTTICVKTWRIYRIFLHSWKPGEYLHNRVLITAVILLVCPVILYCVIRSIVDPLMLSSTEEFQVDNGLPYIEVKSTCQRKWYDAVVLHFYETILLAFALCLSIFTRNVKVAFKTTRSTTALIYFLTLIASTGIPLYNIALALSLDQNVTYSIEYVIYSSVLFVCLLFGFVPPVIPLVREKLNLMKATVCIL